jgi:hypothetical protein
MAKLVHHGTSSARLLLAQVFAILQQRGKTEVVAEVARTLVRQSLTECRGSVPPATLRRGALPRRVQPTKGRCWPES